MVPFFYQVKDSFSQAFAGVGLGFGKREGGGVKTTGRGE